MIGPTGAAEDGRPAGLLVSHGMTDPGRGMVLSSNEPECLARRDNMAGNETEGQIAALVFRAISSFESLISTGDTSLADRATAASHFARFKLWAGSLGAHRASGGRSLEYRLRDASTIKGQIVSLLQDLNVSVAQGMIPAFLCPILSR